MASKGMAGIIGVGTIGRAMAKNLIELGFTLFGHDTQPEAMATLQKLGGTPVSSNAAVLAEAEVIIVSMPSSKALVSVVDDLVKAPKPGRIIAETSTLPIEDKTAAFERLREVGIAMLDCPLSGSANRAMIRDVLVYGSGDKAAYEKCLPVFQGFSRAPHYVGAFGNGSKLKFIANHLVAIHTAAASEAFTLARKAGLDPAMTYDMIIGGAGGSRAMEARKDMLISGKYHPVQTGSLESFRKDLNAIGGFAHSIECPVPMFTASLPLYTAAWANGMALEDNAAIGAILLQMAGIKRG